MKILPYKGRFSFSRDIASSLDQVELLCQAIRPLLLKRVQAQACFVAELVMRECLNNAILHGNKENSSSRVTFRLRGSRGWLWLQIKDQGPGFDWRSRSWKQPPKTQSASGRGLFILHCYAQRVQFNQRGNQITLWLRSPTRADSSAPRRQVRVGKRRVA